MFEVGKCYRSKSGMVTYIRLAANAETTQGKCWLIEEARRYALDDSGWAISVGVFSLSENDVESRLLGEEREWTEIPQAEWDKASVVPTLEVGKFYRMPTGSALAIRARSDDGRLVVESIGYDGKEICTTIPSRPRSSLLREITEDEWRELRAYWRNGGYRRRRQCLAETQSNVPPRERTENDV